jgi:peptidyl-prolyl cis-trans isomerase B (cyclophilin B)
VASSRDRQRKLARAKLDRQMARRAAKERRRRRLLAGVGSGVAVLLIVAGIAWIGGAFDSDDKTTAADQDVCAWTPQSATTNTNLKEVGTPPTKNIPVSGTETMTIKTDQGAPIEVSLDLTSAPCGSEDLNYLASKKFFDNTPCHRLTTEGIYVLQCGDPSGTGAGGPSYEFADENLPTDKRPAYPAGTIAMANAGAGTNGSQFFIVYKDIDQLPPNYTVWGKVTKGLDVVQKVADAGVTPADPSNPGDGKPKMAVTIQSLTMSAPAQ